MIRKVTFAKATSGKTVNARLIIPSAYLEVLGIDENNRDVSIKLEGNKLIIEKAEADE